MNANKIHLLLKKEAELRDSDKVVFGEVLIDDLIRFTSPRVREFDNCNYIKFHNYFNIIEKHLLQGNLIQCYSYLKTLPTIKNIITKEEWGEFGEKILDFLNR